MRAFTTVLVCVYVTGGVCNVRRAELGKAYYMQVWQRVTVRRLQRQLIVTRQVLYCCHVNDYIVQFIPLCYLPDRQLLQQRPLLPELDVRLVYHKYLLTDSYSTNCCNKLLFWFSARAARVLLFSVVSVCVFVCRLFVGRSVNMTTYEPLELSPRNFQDFIHSMVKMSDKFGNGYVYGYRYCCVRTLQLKLESAFLFSLQENEQLSWSRWNSMCYGRGRALTMESLNHPHHWTSCLSHLVHFNSPR